jgi:hypothetical protein
MLKTCPRCGDFFAGDAPPFCPADGTPLADVAPRALDEGTRVVEEKTRLAHRRVRRLKLRRVLTKTMTLVVVTLVVFVVAANYVVYLKPDPEAARLLAAVKPSPSPTSPTPVPLPSPCTDEGRLAAADLIVRENRERWDEAIAREKDEVVGKHVPPAATPTPTPERGRDEGREEEKEKAEGKAELSPPPSYRAAVAKDCQSAAVNVTYSWLVKWDAALGREEGSKTVEGERSFVCSNDGDAWRCP